MNRDNMHNLNESTSGKARRPRRILSLEERVRVIKEYERKPVYQQMAYMFDCSSDQIKSIIANKESIMQYYNNIVNGSQNEAHVIRQRKIAFLGRLVHEYIERARCYPDVPIDIEAIRLKALEFKKAIKIENFFPNNTWMENFKTSYNLQFPIKRYRLRPTSQFPSLDMNRIIDYVRSPTDNNRLNFSNLDSRGGDSHHYDFTERNGETDYDPLEDLEPTSRQQQQLNNEHGDNEYDCYGYGGANSYPEVVQLESDDDDADEKQPSAKINRSSSKQSSLKSSSTNFSSESASTTIANYADALAHLAPLEEFVLQQENYRAIGLISQLEILFKNPPKTTD